MKLSKKVVLLAAVTGSVLAGCGDGSSRNTLYFNNYSHADTEGFEFLKTVAEEANFLQTAGVASGNASLGSTLKTTYGEIAAQIHELSHRQYVLTPGFENQHYQPGSVQVKDLVASQERVVSQFKRVLENTNVEIAGYAREHLATVEQLLADTKGTQ